MDKSFLDWMTKRLKGQDDVETVVTDGCPYCRLTQGLHQVGCPLNDSEGAL